MISGRAAKLLHTLNLVRLYTQARHVERNDGMKEYTLILAVIGAVAGLALQSCESGAGTGAAVGAGTGAVVGGPPGAAVGAAAGAIVGATVTEKEAVRYGPAPAGGYPLARRSGRAGFVLSPYTNREYDVRGVPHGALVRDVDTNKLFRRP